MSALTRVVLRREGALWDNPSSPVSVVVEPPKSWERICKVCNLVTHEQNVRVVGCVDCVAFGVVAHADA